MLIYKEYPFVFSRKYRLIRHLIFWLVQIPVFSFLFKLPGTPYWHMHIMSALWIPAFIIYAYPIMYMLIPRYLLREKYMLFAILLINWAVAGYFLNYFFRLYVLFPISDQLEYKAINNPWAATSYLTLNVMASFAWMILFFQLLVKKTNGYTTDQKDKTNIKEKDLKNDHLGSIQIQYLYMRSFFTDLKVNEGITTAQKYYQQQAKQFWNKQSNYLKAMNAAALYRNHENDFADKNIIPSILETSFVESINRMYWKKEGDRMICSYHT